MRKIRMIGLLAALALAVVAFVGAGPASAACIAHPGHD